MKVTFSMRLDDGLRKRLEERATVEGRTLANLIERLLTLGLGTVVTERGGESAGQSGLARASGSLSGGDRPEDLGRVSQPPLSVTPETCPFRFGGHNPGTKCEKCGGSFPVARREVKPDPKVKP